MPAIVTPTENKRAVIAFARRLADHLSVGVEEFHALPIVAQHLRATGSEADRQVADAADAIRLSVQNGYTKEAWEPQAHLLGEHLVSLVSNSYADRKLAGALYAAADTLESDLRTGYAS